MTSRRQHGLIFALLIALAAPALAQISAPTCWVVTNATGYISGATSDGRYAAWWCPTEWDRSATLLVMKTGYVLIHPSLPANASAASTAEAYWRANVARDCNANNAADPPMQRLCAAANAAAMNNMPLSRYIVSPYPNATYRATYTTSAAVGGVRATPASGKVPILTAGYPTACNCAQGRVVETSATGNKTTYCSVGGVATTVANCRLR